MQENSPTFPPALLFRSFLLVAGAYICNLMIVGAAAVGVLIVWYPDSFEILNGDPEQFNAIFEANPDKVFPRSFLWIVLCISCPVCFVFGYAIAMMSPLAKFPHAILFAAILFVQYLQLAIGATDTMQRMFVLFMAASPVAAILGANFYLTRAVDEED